MHAVARVIPRQEFGRRPFDRKVLINTQFGRTIISEDMEYLLGTMEVVTAPGPVDLRDANGQEMSCTGIISFSMKFLMPNGTDFEDNSCQVTAWVSPMLRDNIIVGSMTLADLGYPGVEDIPAGVVFHMDPQPWDAPINDPFRPPGEDAEVAIAEDWLVPFTENWKRAVVYRHNNPKMCDIYYTAPDGAKLRSHNEALKYFVNNPDSSILPSKLCWLRKPIGLNNLFYETIRQAKKRETKPPPLPNSDPLEFSTNAFEPW